MPRGFGGLAAPVRRYHRNKSSDHQKPGFSKKPGFWASGRLNRRSLAGPGRRGASHAPLGADIMTVESVIARSYSHAAGRRSSPSAEGRQWVFASSAPTGTSSTSSRSWHAGVAASNDWAPVQSDRRFYEEEETSAADAYAMGRTVIELHRIAFYLLVDADHSGQRALRRRPIRACRKPKRFNSDDAVCCICVRQLRGCTRNTSHSSDAV